LNALKEKIEFVFKLAVKNGYSGCGMSEPAKHILNTNQIR